MATAEELTVEREKVHGCSSCAGVGPGYATPIEAMKGPLEKLLYVTAIYTGTNLHQILFLS
jgi:selenium-binding protein 1